MPDNNLSIRLALTIEDETESFPIDQQNEPDQWAWTMQRVAEKSRRHIEEGHGVTVEFGVYRNEPDGRQMHVEDFPSLKAAAEFIENGGNPYGQDAATRLLESIAAVSAEFHTSDKWQGVYDRNADAVNGFPGFWMYCGQAGNVFAEAETAFVGTGKEFEWIDAIMAFVAGIYQFEETHNALPEGPELRKLADTVIAAEALEVLQVSEQTRARLEYLRGELRAERISYGGIVELQTLAPFIQPDDNELREAAGLPEGDDNA